MSALAGPAAAAAVRYYGVTRMSDGWWRSYITNKEGHSRVVGHFDMAEEAALAHDRAILAILGLSADFMVFNFRAGFSDTELRFLKGRHALGRYDAIIVMIKTCTYDAEFVRFAEHACDAYMDPELALDVMNFRFVYRDMLNQGKAEADNPEAEQDVKRDVFLGAARNKATDMAWVRSFHHRCLHMGMAFEDESRWPQVLPEINVDVGDNFVGNELIYLSHGSSYVDEMIMF